MKNSKENENFNQSEKIENRGGKRAGSGRKPKETRTRNWVCMLYPESLKTLFNCDDNEVEKKLLLKLESMAIRYILSPLHSEDIYTIEDENRNRERNYNDFYDKKITQEDYEKNCAMVKAGEKKKAHYHLILLFGSVKSYKQVLDIVSKELNVNYVEKVDDIVAHVQYLIHKNQPSKHQYSKADIKYSPDVDIESYFVFNVKDELENINKIMKICNEKKMYEFCDVMDYLNENEKELFRYAYTKTYFVREYLKSKIQSQIRKEKKEMFEMYFKSKNIKDDKSVFEDCIF